MNARLSVAVAALTTLAVGTFALAQGSVIEQRQALMKSNGAQAGILVKMSRGEIPFDASAAKTALATIAQNMETFPSLFPEGSDTGETKAGPAIWADKAGFESIAAKLGADATAAAGPVSTIEDVQAALQVIGADCSACHRQYQSP